MKRRGFTLIEAVIYIALLAFIMGSVLVTVFSIVQSSASTSSQMTAEEEGTFVMQKIDWALTSTSSLASVISPMPGQYGSTLSLTDASGLRIDILYNSGSSSIEMQEGALGYMPLTSTNVAVSSLQFHFIPPSVTTPGGIEASTTIDGEEFYMEKLFPQ